MLLSLTIRDVVLIDRLDLTFPSGLCVLTGETGAGKSILLDALGLALGARAESALVRHGAPRRWSPLNSRSAAIIPPDSYSPRPAFAPRATRSCCDGS
jgi:ABC-type hemin transport system ATPase subunit